MSEDHQSRAIYVLANDAVYEWLVALLISIRRHLPDATVRLIPFDDRTARLKALRSRFDFDLFEHDSFEWLLEIGVQLEIGRAPLGPNWFKRFAAFFGREDSFLYIDARTLLLSGLSAGFEAVGSGALDFVHFGGDPNQSFESGAVRRQFAAAGRCFGFNSGLWISRGGLFSKEQLLETAAFCATNRKQLNPRNTDQFFLNALCARSTVRVANFADLDGDFERDPWAFAHHRVFHRADEVRVWDHGGLSHGKRLPLVHWAGVGLSSAMPLRRLWTRYRYDGRPPVGVRLEPFTSIPTHVVGLARRSMLVRRFISPKNAGL